jgi:hypothetical protein
MVSFTKGGRLVTFMTDAVIDFSLVLATIITSLKNFMKLCPRSDVDMIDIMGSVDAYQEQQDDKAMDEQDGQKIGLEDDLENYEDGVDDEELTNVLKAFCIIQE